jgi:hypothetical protein
MLSNRLDMYQKSLLVIFIIIASLCSCGHKSPSINLVALGPEDLNSPAYTSFLIPDTGIWKERKHSHDSCFGAAFEPNAMFLGRTDSFLLGSIFNKKTMNPVLEVDLRKYGLSTALKAMTIVTKPCYDEVPGHVSVDAFFNTKVVARLANTPEDINNEINGAIRKSVNEEAVLSSWSYINLQASGIHILDATSNGDLQAYKRLLLEKDNIMLFGIAGVNNVSFTIKSQNKYSGGLIAALTQKPFVDIQNIHLSAQLFYIDDHTFQINFVGFYPVMGEFMKCVEEQ